MNTDLFLLLWYNFGFFFYELDVFEILHFLVDYFFLEAQPNITGYGKVVDSSAD